MIQKGRGGNSGKVFMVKCPFHPERIWFIMSFSPGENMLYKGGIVDTPIGILLSSHQSVHLIFCHPLSQRCQHMAQLCSHDGAIAFLVKNPEPLHKILKVALIFCTGDMLQHWQEGLKVHHFSAHVLWPWFPKHFENICIGRVLAKSSHHISTLGICDLHFSSRCAVEQGESLLELLNLVSAVLKSDAFGIKRRLLGWLRQWLWRRSWLSSRSSIFLRLWLFGLRFLWFNLLWCHVVKGFRGESVLAEKQARV